MPESTGFIPPGLRYRHPLGWYNVAVPPGWLVDAFSEPARFFGPEREAIAVVSVAKIAGVLLPPARYDFLRREIPGLSVLHRFDVGQGERYGLTWARAEEILGKKLSWWKRIFQRPVPESHVVNVCYTRGSLLVLMTIQVQPNRLERHRLMIDAMINSLGISGDPAPAPPEFIERFVALVQERLPARAVKQLDEPLAVSIDGAHVALDPAYRNLREQMATSDRVLNELCRYLVDRPDMALGADSFEDLSDRVLPLIKPNSWVESRNSASSARQKLLSIPLPNATSIVFTVNDDVATRFVSADDAERWEVVPRRMVEIARENLGAKSHESRGHVITGEDGIAQAVAVADGDGYDAARLLLPDLRARLEEHLGMDFAVAIPNRDLLVAFRPPLLQRIQLLLNRGKSVRPHPITDGLFRISEEGAIERFEG